MHVLDLDLDFFLDRVSHRHPYGRRHDEEEGDTTLTPWAEDEFRSFLEGFCGLSTKDRVSGRVLRHHDEAFYCWRELIRRGVLEVPFKLTHIDAHSDLGMGDGQYVYIMGELLERPAEQRVTPDRTKVFPGNYLVYVAACRWASEMLFVQHPRQRDDLPRWAFKDYDTGSGFLQLKRCDPMQLRESVSRGGNVPFTPPIDLEPPIPVSFVSALDYRAQAPFDYVVLAQSPDYTPSTADGLISVFREYITED